MKDLIDILCWFVSLIKMVFVAFNIDSGILDDLTGKIKDMDISKFE